MERQQDVILTPHHLKKWTQALLESDSPAAFDPLQTYQLQRSDFIEGIPCPDCGSSPLQRGYNGWTCPRCHFQSQDAHTRHILDYLQLFNQITNKECQRLLQLSSPYTVSRLLTSMKLPNKGTTKGRVYFNPN